MQTYIVSLAAGVLVGVIYGLITVRSPAPPMIALVGLLGILAGEQVVPIVKRVVRGDEVVSFLKTSATRHVFGAMPHNDDCADNSANLGIAGNDAHPAPQKDA